MNQNNNYNFDPVSGQPMNSQMQQPENNNVSNQAIQGGNMHQQAVQTPQINTGSVQQPMQPQQLIQPQQSYNTYQQPPQPVHPPKKNKILIIVVIIVIIGVIVGLVFLLNQDKKEPVNNNWENIDNLENIDTNVDSVGTVDEDTNTSYDENGAFLFTIEDTFTISGRGTVVTGIVERGTIKIGDEVQVIGLNEEIITTTVTGVEVFRKNQDYATVGDNPGLLLKDVERDQVKKGQVVAKPDSIIAVKKFDADVYMLTKEESGQKFTYFSENATFNLRGIDLTGTIDLPDDVGTFSPGDNVSFSVTLENLVALEVGTEFSINQDDVIIAKGMVTKLY